MYDNEDKQWLYGKFVDAGLDIGTYEGFDHSLQNDEDKKWYYEKATGMGLDVGTYDEFDKVFGKKPRQAKPSNKEYPITDIRNPQNPMHSQDEFTPPEGMDWETNPAPAAEAKPARRRRLVDYILGNAGSPSEQVAETTQPELRYKSDANGDLPQALKDAGLTAKDVQFQWGGGQSGAGYYTLTPEQKQKVDNAYAQKILNEGYEKKIRKDYGVQIDEAMSDADKYKTQLDEMSSRVPEIPAAPGAIVSPKQATLMANKDYVRLQQAYTDALERAHKLEMMRDGTINSFWANAGDALLSPEKWTFGLASIYKAGILADAMKNQDDLTSQETLSQALLRNETEAEFFHNQSNKGRWGTMTGEMARFMLLNAAGSGLFEKTGKAVEGAIRGASESFGRKFLGKMANDLTLAALTANTVGAANTIAEALQNKQGFLTQKEDGSYAFEDGQGWWKSIWNAEANQITEYFTERLGEHFGPAGQRIAEKLGLKAVSDFITREPVYGLEKGLRNFFKAAGVNHYPGEVLEEEAGIILSNLLQWQNPVTNVKNAVHDLFDGKQQADIWGGMAFSIGLMQAVPISLNVASRGYNHYYGNRLNHRLNSADKEGEAAFGDGWEVLRDRIDNTVNEDISPLVYEIAQTPETQMSAEQKRTALNYIDGLLRLRGFTTGTMSEMQRQMMKGREDAANDLLGRYGKFWMDEELVYGDKKEERRPLQFARRVSFGDQTGFVVGEDNGDLLVNVGGQARIVKEDALTEDTGRVPLFVILDERNQEMMAALEQERMRIESQNNANNLAQRAIPGATVEVGAEESKEQATIIGQENGDYILQKTDGTILRYSPKQIADAFGLPYEVKSNDQLAEIDAKVDELTNLFDQKIGNTYVFNRLGGVRGEIVNARAFSDQDGSIKVELEIRDESGSSNTQTIDAETAEQIISDIDGDTADQINTKIEKGATLNVQFEDGTTAQYQYVRSGVQDGETIIVGRGTDGEEVDLLPDMVTNFNDLMGNATDVEGKPVPVAEEPKPVEEQKQIFDDPVANSLGIGEEFVYETKDGRRVVNSTELWNKNPELWAKWNDQNTNRITPTIDYLSSKAKVLDDTVATKRKELDAANTSGADQGTLEDLQEELRGLVERQSRVRQLYDSYVAAEEEARLAEPAAPAPVVAENPTPEITPVQREELNTIGTTPKQAAMDVAQAKLDDIAKRNTADLPRTRKVELMREKAVVLQEMFNQIGEENTTVSTREDILKQYKRDGGSNRAAALIEYQLNKTAKKGQKLRGFYSNGKIYLIADDIVSTGDANLTNVHEGKHLENTTTNAPQESLKTGITKQEMADAVYRLTGSDSYSDFDEVILADEILANAAEIAERRGVENVPQTLRAAGITNEDFINFVTNNIENGRRSQYLPESRRNSLQSNDSEVDRGQDVRNPETGSGALEGQLGSSGGSRPSVGAGEAVESPAAEAISDRVGDNATPEEIRLNDAGVASNPDEARLSVRYAPTEEEAKQIAQDISTETGVPVKKAEDWVKSETSLAAIILDEHNAPYLNYVADDRYTAIKNDSDYPQGTVDFNNICRKRLAFTGMFQRIQNAFPNTVITGRDLAIIRQIMKDHGETVACGLCYVEDRRQLLGEIANGFINDLRDGFKGYSERKGFLDKPNDTGNKKARKKVADELLRLVGNDAKEDLTIYDLLTLDGSQRLYNEHRGIYDAFQRYNSARGQQAGNLFQGYAEYKREILRWTPAKVASVNGNGGLRVFSYSDFEAHHLIDLVQIIQDCARKGVMIQGYTKVPAFARAVANTGIKLNRSLIPLGDTGIVDGKLAYDPVEGIDINDPDFLESNDNIGNILIGINDEQIALAMRDPFIHYIIPYHSNQSGVLRQMKQTGAWTNYKNEQLEKGGKEVNIYKDVLAAAEAEGKPIKNERQFVNKFLQVCRERGLTPRFSRFLNVDSKGNFAYRQGYYKLLLDFKLFDENGKILPQKPVLAKFDDDFNAQILRDYVAGEESKESSVSDEIYNEIVEKLGLERRGPGIQFSIVNRSQDVFVSNAQKAVEGIKMEKATPEQWLKMIEKGGGLKAGEDKWIGLSDWLRSSDRKSLTKQEVSDFIEQNRIRIEEVKYGGSLKDEIRDTIGRGRSLDELQREIDEIRESEEYKEIAGDDIDDSLLTETMVDRYGDDFELGYIIDTEGKIDYQIDPFADEDFRANQVGDTRPIHNIRMGYTTEGLENNREIALTVPTIEPWNESDEIHFGDAGEGRAVAWIRFGDATVSSAKNAAEAAYREADKAWRDYRNEIVNKYALQATGTKTTKDLATPEENARVLELRLESDRLYHEWQYGRHPKEKVLVIDEIQSKRHQEGREHGYKNQKAIAALQDKADDAKKAYDEYIDSLKEKYGGFNGMAGNITEEENRRAEELNDAHIAAQNAVIKSIGSVPAAPFEKNWHELAMKRMLRLAAEEGYDYVAWTTGEQQAERYDLGNIVSRIDVNPSNNSEERIVNIHLANSDGDYHNLLVDNNGMVTHGQYSGHNIGDVVGKDLAAKIMSAKERTEIQGDGLRVGGEGMKGFYDDILPRFMNKYGKKWGTKVEDLFIPNIGEDASAGIAKGLTMHAVPVTEEMKESVMEGQPMFSVKGQIDKQGNPINSDGSLKLEEVESIDNLTDEDFTNPSRNVVLPQLSAIVESAIGTGGKPIVIKKNIFERNAKIHRDLTPEQSRDILGNALYNTSLYGQNQPVSRPYNWVVINVPGDDNTNKLVLLEINADKDNVEIVHWHYIDKKGLGKIERQAKREGGRILILPSVSEEAGALAGRPFGESSESKDTDILGTSNASADNLRENGGATFSIVADQDKINELEAGNKVKVYRSMQLIDGELYPPMSAKVGGELREPSLLGSWEQSEEHPELADKDGNFKLDKGNGNSLKAAYAPYFHSRLSPLNEQFSEAYNRPNLVIVEGEIPESELTSGYIAEGSKKSVGEHDWASGKVSNALAKQGDDTRKVILSRWFKPVRIVTNSEVADIIANKIGQQDITFPYNTVTPGLREELRKRGVRFEGWQGNKPKNVDEIIAGMKRSDNVIDYLFNGAESIGAGFDSAIEDLNKDGISIDDKALLRGYNLSNVTISKKGNVVKLDKLVVADQNNGNGTRFMNNLIAEADANGWTLALTPDDSFGATSVKRLKDFYKRFGFKENKGRNTDFTINESMIRRPNDGTRFSITAKENEEYMNAVNSGDMDKAQELVDKAAEQAGYTIHAYHGTARADRVGNVFRPDRATSGPMAFFTDDRTLAEGYARGKQDTSVAYDSDYDSYQTQFRTRDTKTGKDYSVYDIWNLIPFSERRKIEDKAKHIRGQWEEDGAVIYDPKTDDANGGWSYQVSDNRGNILRALNTQWLESGNLFGRENDYLKVLELAGVNEALEKMGFEAPRYMDPEYREEAVYDVHLRIQNPFDVAEMVNDEFISGLRNFADEHEQEYMRETAAADSWDKNSITAEEFIENVERDIEQGTSYAWTQIPDVVTAYLKELGHDGIKDQSGKFGGEVHTVWIPFSSEQIKRTDAVTRDDNGNVIPLDRRFDRESNDIRFSVSAEEDAEYMEAANAGDEKRAQELVDKAAEKSGYTIKAFHGGPYRFHTFDRNRLGQTTDAPSAREGFFFTDDEDLANEFAQMSLKNTDWDDIRDRIREGLGTASEEAVNNYYNIYKEADADYQDYLSDSEDNSSTPSDEDFLRKRGFLDDEKTIDGAKRDYIESIIERNVEDGLYDEWEEVQKELKGLGIELGHTQPVYLKLENPLIDNNERDYFLGGAQIDEPMTEVIRKAKRDGHDGVIFTDIREGGQGDYATQYVIFGENQIKSRDLIERDDSGNIIPLSERFNDANDDIRFSLRGVIGAQNDETAMQNLDIAKEMEKAGKDATTIWAATGWEKGVDGKWRNEIKDATPKEIANGKRVFKVGDIIDASDLFASYPEIKDYKVTFKKIKGAVGQFMREDKTVAIDPDYGLTYKLTEEQQNEVNKATLDYIRNEGVSSERKALAYKKKLWEETGERTLSDDGLDTILHELQHAIQAIEGFAKGGNTNNEKTRIFRDAIDKDPISGSFGFFFCQNNPASKLWKAGRKGVTAGIARSISTMSVADQELLRNLSDYLSNCTDSEYLDLIHKGHQLALEAKQKAPKNYHNLAGEVEARNVSARHDMSEEDRAAIPPSETEGVPRDEQGIRFSIAYHGSPADFTEFEEGHYREGVGSFHRPGFYFASDEKSARPYAYDRGNGAFMYEVELPDDNGTNYIHVFRTIPKSQRRELAERIQQLFPEKGIDVEKKIVNKPIAGEDLMGMFTNDELEKLGYVGIVGPMRLATMPEQQYIMFNPKDIKMLSKTNVTTDETTRFSVVSRDEAISRVEKGGLAGVIGEENVAPLMRSVYAAIPKIVKAPIVDKALTRMDFHKPLNEYLHDLAAKGTENDETGLLFAMYDEIRALAGNPELTDGDIRYMIWKSTGESNGDILSMAEDIAMKNRWNVGKDEPRFSVRKQDLTEVVEDSQEKLDEKTAAAAEKLKTVAEAVPHMSDLLNPIITSMAAQKEYDRATVDGIVDFAKQILKNGGVSTLTTREFNRLLTIIKSSTGKSPKSVTKYSEELLDKLIDHMVKDEQAKFDKLINIKDVRLNQSGVAAVGSLDVSGQITMRALRDYMFRPQEEIDNRIAEVENKFDSSDKKTREDARAEFEGLKLASDYQRDLAANIKEGNDLENGLDEAKDAMRTGDFSRKDYAEFAKVTEQQIRENKIARVDLYRDFKERLAELQKGSKNRAHAFREAERERVERIHHLANLDMQGTPNKEHLESSWKSRALNSTGVRFFLKPLATFDQMLRLFGRSTLTGEGFLYNHFGRGWIDAREKELIGKEEAIAELDKKVKEVFDDPKMRWSKLYDKERKMKGATVYFFDGGEKVAHDLTPGNLLYIYMANKMVDGKMKLRRMGISEEDVQAIQRSLDPEFIELADWIQGEFLPKRRAKYNAVHEEMFGASMAAIDDYFPLKILSNARVENIDLADDPGASGLTSTTTGSIIKRQKNSLALDLLNTDAFNLVVEHVEEMENWAAFAKLRRDMNTLLSYKRFRNQVQNMATVYGSGKVLWDNFRDVASVAMGNYRPKVGKQDIDTLALNVAKGVTGAKISFRIGTALKQFLSAPAFLSDARLDDLVKNLATAPKAWTWCMENLPIFRERWNSRFAGDTRLMKTESDWKLWKTKLVREAGKLGMSPNAFVDALTVAVGAKSMYDTNYRRYVEGGYSEEEADRKAKQDATILYNQTQQSSEAMFTSAMQLDRTLGSVMLTVFRNSSMGYNRQTHDALRIYGRMMQDGYKERAIDRMTRQRMEDGLSEDEAKAFAEKEYKRQYWRSAARIGVFAFLLPLAWNYGIGDLLYLLFGDDDKEKEKIHHDALMHTLAGPVEGLTAGSVISSAWGTYSSTGKTANISLAELPIESDMAKILSMVDYDAPAAVAEIFNLIVQSGIGVNPQTFTDAIVATIDAFEGDMDTAKEFAIWLMRVNQLPQPSIERFLVDEFEMTPDEAKAARLEDLAKRYADYKMRKGAISTLWMYDPELEAKRRKSYEKKFKKKVTDRENLHVDDQENN